MRVFFFFFSLALDLGKFIISFSPKHEGLGGHGMSLGVGCRMLMEGWAVGVVPAPAQAWSVEIGL